MLKRREGAGRAPAPTQQAFPHFKVRPAGPSDVGALLRLKRALTVYEKSEHVLRATESDWLRDAFGERPRFKAFVAERDGHVFGMVTCSERYYTGWAGSTLLIQDLFVEPAFRGSGAGRALLGCARELAECQGNLLIELTVHETNPARRFYRRLGFERVRNCLNYVVPTITLDAANADPDRVADPQDVPPIEVGAEACGAPKHRA
jgi:GNAT superfamily N-acetyltransferase